MRELFWLIAGFPLAATALILLAGVVALIKNQLTK